jgi:hypothetical protein
MSECVRARSGCAQATGPLRSGDRCGERVTVAAYEFFDDE